MAGSVGAKADVNCVGGCVGQLPAGINLRVTVERPLAIPLPRTKATASTAAPAELQSDPSGIPPPRRAPLIE